MNPRTESSVIEKAELRAPRQKQSEGPKKPPLMDQLLGIAAEHRGTLAKAVLISAVVSLIIAFLIPVRYESACKVMPPEGQNPGALLAAVSGKIPAGLGELAGGLLGTKNEGPLWVNLLQSRTVLDHQVSRFELQKLYWKKYREAARKKLASRTSISEDKKSGVITIAVEDGSPERAQALTANYVAELDQLLATVSTSAARRERMFVEHRLESAKSDLSAAEVDFSRFASKNSTLDVKEQTKAMVTASAELQGQIIAAESELQGLQETYSGNNIRIRTLKARIGELKRQLAKLNGTGDVSSTTLPAGEMYPAIRQLPILGVEWADLFRKVKIQETIFELLTQQYELAKIQEAKEIPTVRVIDPADYPEKKSWPPRGLITLAGTLLGLLGTLAWFWLQNEWRSREEDDPWRVRVGQVFALFHVRLAGEERA